MKLSFSEALIYLKTGKKIYREGWNGKDLYIIQVVGCNQALNFECLSNDIEMMPFFLLIDMNRKKANTWVPSISDLNSVDWMIQT